MAGSEIDVPLRVHHCGPDQRLLGVENHVEPWSQYQFVVTGEGKIRELAFSKIVVCADFPKLRRHGEQRHSCKQRQDPIDFFHVRKFLLLIPAASLSDSTSSVPGSHIWT